MISFFSELRRRNVIRASVAYVVVAWLIAQVAELALDSFDAPSWVIKTILLVLALGFPLAIFFAWAFELTPEGIKKEKDIDRSQSITGQTGRKLDFVIIGLLSVALVYFAATHDWSDETQGDAIVNAGAAGPKSIAVLPFANMSDSQENAFFASGVHEDILTYLAKVADLHVISRTSVRQYADDQRDLKTIAAELGVNHIVEGSVRRAGNKVRVTAQLIDARTDQHLWAENYDRDLTDVFEIQTAVAREIVTALKASLSPEEQRVIETAPTSNIDAYDLYSQARAISRDSDYGRPVMVRMAPLLEQAVAIDPDFALAHAMLGSVYSNFYWLNIDKSTERLEKAKASIDIAFALQPELPEARAALAEYFYRGFYDYKRALQELLIAHDKYPSNTEVMTMMGLSQRRLGKFADSIDSFKAAVQLDPGNLSIKKALLDTLIAANRWVEAEQYAEDLLKSYPEDKNLIGKRASILLSAYGDVHTANRLVTEAGTGPDVTYLFLDVMLSVHTGDFEGALAKLDNYNEILDKTPALRLYLRSNFYAWKGDEAKVRELAARIIELVSPIIEETDGTVVPMQLVLAESQVRLGQKSEALARVEHVLTLSAVARDAYEGPAWRAWAAYILVLCGETDRGLKLLESVANKPGGPTSWDLKLDPNWNVLRENPRFMALSTPSEN